MKHPIETSAGGPAGQTWTPITALQLAWTTWVVLLLMPFVIFPLTLHLMPSSGGAGPKPELAQRWYNVVMSYLVVAVPVGLVIRAIMFKSYWRGRPVPPRRYYAGMLLVWSILIAGGLAAELVCVTTATLVPNVLPGMLALIVFLSLWPTGRAMDRRNP